MRGGTLRVTGELAPPRPRSRKGPTRHPAVAWSGVPRAAAGLVDAPAGARRARTRARGAPIGAAGAETRALGAPIGAAGARTRAPRTRTRAPGGPAGPLAAAGEAV